MKYDELGEPRPLSGEDKFLAGMGAVFLMLLAAMAIIITWVVITSLWAAGFLSAMIIIGVIVVLVGIWRVIYRILLKKDIL